MPVACAEKASPSPLPPPPEVKSLARRSRRYQIIDFVLIPPLLAVNAALLFAVLRSGTWYLLVISVVLLLLSYCIHLAWTLSLFKHPKAALAELGPATKVGNYQGAQIYLMLQELLAPHRGKEKPQVYITRLKYDGAFVVNSLFFNFIKPLNAVYISQHLFNILRPNEIKAVIAHELAHFYRYIRPLNRVCFALMGFNALLPIYLTTLANEVSLVNGFVIWLVVSILFNRVANAWIARTSRDHEYLCDLEAARRYGIINLANGLFGLSKTAEIQAKIYRSLLERIRKDATLSIASLEDLAAQCEARLAARPVGSRELDRILKDALHSPTTQNLRKRLSPKELAKEEKRIDEIAQRLLLNGRYALIEWKRFDHIIPDGRISRGEYERCIRSLQSSPEQQLFDLPHDNVEIASKGTHPTIAQRILFLEQARQQDPSIPL